MTPSKDHFEPKKFQAPEVVAQGQSSPGIAALNYAKHGCRVFPIQPNDKRPFPGSHGCLDATTDPVTITDLWNTHPDANVAIATGNGLIVIDIDTKKGEDGWGSLDALMVEHGELPGTRWAQTPNAGAHLYYRVIGEVRNSESKIGPGLDVRGDGGYVLAPPSTINGKSYKWMGRSPSAQLPPAWEALLIAKPDAPVPVTVPALLPTGKKARQAYLLAALEGERDALRDAPEGTRNGALNRFGFSLGQLVHLGLLADDIVATAEWAMDQWTWTHGHRDRRKDAATLGRAIRDGMNHPREEVAA
ncbi:MAG: bifunctional DNA primase/polymerase [Myxococcales bacterium]|nr:bifunctional DNA primase/polymerase [Myxococcales bacterium]